MIKDIYNKKDFISYIFNIIFNNKNINIAIIETAQILLIYEYINNKLRRNFFYFINNSIIINLLKEFRYRKNI